jgi:hypothetical protein
VHVRAIFGWKLTKEKRKEVDTVFEHEGRFDDEADSASLGRGDPSASMVPAGMLAPKEVAPGAPPELAPSPGPSPAAAPQAKSTRPAGGRRKWVQVHTFAEDVAGTVSTTRCHPLHVNDVQ